MPAVTLTTAIILSYIVPWFVLSVAIITTVKVTMFIMLFAK